MCFGLAVNSERLMRMAAIAAKAQAQYQQRHGQLISSWK